MILEINYLHDSNKHLPYLTNSHYHIQKDAVANPTEAQIIASKKWLWNETKALGMDHISTSSTLIQEQKSALMTESQECLMILF